MQAFPSNVVQCNVSYLQAGHLCWMYHQQPSTLVDNAGCVAAFCPGGGGGSVYLGCMSVLQASVRHLGYSTLSH